MTLSRDQLEPLLEKLDQSIPGLIAEHPDHREFLGAVVTQADAMTSKADPEDHSWLHGQIGNILARHGQLHEDLLPLSYRQTP
ncbi:hypothetical protein [Rhodanobacter sp. L36]|uniref:hypothetical protein n=1 Tax=Rhodanobacter sp. L36 TaxID=1747221 RepID=UPI00131EBDEC|nr:hypothetical protein [Rhodanobacter sp. L36]